MEHQQISNITEKQSNQTAETPTRTSRPEASNSGIGVDSRITSSISASDSSSPRTQKIRRKPSPKDVALPEDDTVLTEDVPISIVNLDLLYSNTSSLPPLSLNLSPTPASNSSTSNSSDYINARPFLSPELGQTVPRDGTFPLNREIPTFSIPPAHSLIAPPIQSPTQLELPYTHHLSSEHCRQDSLTSLDELIPKEIESIAGGGNRRDSLIAIESSFSRMQNMFDVNLKTSVENLEEEEEWKEGEGDFEGNSITDIMLREESLDELLEAHDSILEALDFESDEYSLVEKDLYSANSLRRPKTSQASSIVRT